MEDSAILKMNRKLNLGSPEQIFFIKDPKQGLPLEDRETYEIAQKQHLLELRLQELQRVQDTHNVWQQQAYD
jgi:alkyl sulfatase BDS1-like metallo-beta-lactamase superfamily hydrolase